MMVSAPMVQLCFKDQAGFALLSSELGRIAAERQLRVVDNGPVMQRRFEKSDDPTIRSYARTGDIKLLDLALVSPEGFFVSAANWTIPGPQVVVFLAVPETSRPVQELNAYVVEQLRMHWELHTVPEGKGALPLEGCE